jgi:hypothetical protein
MRESATSAESNHIHGVSSRGAPTAADPENFIGGDRRHPCARLDCTRLHKGIELAYHPPIARHLQAIIEAQRRLPMAYDLGSSPLRCPIPRRCSEFEADTSGSGD